jgi:hypothetical protein
MVTAVAALSGVVYAVSCFSTQGASLLCRLGASGVLRILLDVFGVWGPLDPPRRLLWSTEDNDVGAY